MRDLQEDSDSVAGLTAGVFAGTVLQFFHNLQRVVDGTARLFTMDVDNGSDPAGIMLKRRTIQRVSILILIHNDLLL
jgi:hypothetical protein